MPFTLPELPYAYDALMPYMSKETLEFHHDKHHNAYVVKGNELAQAAGLGDKTLEQVVVSSFKNPAQAGLFNNAGQHWNHIHFWNWMKKDGGPKSGKAIPANLESMINQSFGSYDSFRGKFIEAGMTQFGSGWCWLILDANGKLDVMKTPNGENPLAQGKTALLGCDVWEHSYYIDYRNARQKYLEAFMDSLVNWEYVAELFEKGPVKIAA
ncbi:MAG: superoxide dismutase [Alphaproteobacteria bacterium]|nr:superoxide dismutase [Alphaproteobacteria bacterium]QQS56696.1 MAG: superoxide dismutase [Alphaproteobacteria bacterium]